MALGINYVKVKTKLLYLHGLCLQHTEWTDRDSYLLRRPKVFHDHSFAQALLAVALHYERFTRHFISVLFEHFYKKP